MGLRTRLAHLPLRVQVRMALSGITMLALLLAAGALLVIETLRTEDDLRAELQALAELVADRSSAALAFGDERTAQETLDALKRLDSVGRACMFDARGRLLARLPADASSMAHCTAVDAAAQTWGQVRVTRPVLAGSETVGQLSLQSAPAALRRRLEPKLLGLLAALIGAGALTLWITGPLQRRLVAPLDRIRDAAGRILESGDLRLRVPEQGPVELARTAGAFNRLLDNLADAQDSLRAREHYARALFETSHLAQLVLERESLQVRDANLAATQLLGQGQSLLNADLAPLLGQPDGWAPPQWSRLDFDTTQGLELQRVRPGAEPQVLALHFLRVTLPDRDLVHCSLEDISERKAYERGLQEAKEALEQRVAERTVDLARTIDNLNKTRDHLVASEKQVALGRLVAGLAHELNTPIGNALMAVSTVDDARREFSRRLDGGLRRSELQHFMTRVGDGTELAVRNLDRVVELVTTFKQVAADQASSMRREFELGDLVQDVLQMLGPQLRRSGCTLKVDCASGLHMFSHAGPIEQILVNLVNNALLHAFEGREPGRLQVSAQRLLHGDAQLRLVVEDDGVGIAAAHMSRIFDPFFTTKMGRGGTGLGLSIVQGLCTNLLGGTLRVESTPGQGTRFVIDLPLRAPDAEPAQPG